MLTNTTPYKFNELYERILNSRSGEPAIRGKNLRARITGTPATGDKRRITIRHYQTDILTVEEYSTDGTLYLWIDCDGYRSATTKHYLGEALSAYNTGYTVFQKDFEWFVRGSEQIEPFEDCFAVWGMI